MGVMSMIIILMLRQAVSTASLRQSALSNAILRSEKVLFIMDNGENTAILRY
jgi:hypothetical protein